MICKEVAGFQCPSAPMQLHNSPIRMQLLDWAPERLIVAEDDAWENTLKFTFLSIGPHDENQFARRITATSKRMIPHTRRTSFSLDVLG